MDEIDIKKKIHNIRGLQVMLDRDLAELYEIPVKALNQAVKRNINRFPEDFMFQLNNNELDNFRSQFVIANLSLRSQNVTLKRGKHRKYLPYVFTEQGVAALSGVLKNEKAIKINIQIIRAFVKMRKFISKNAELFTRLDNIDRKHIEYDKNFEKVFNALETYKPKQGIFFDGQVFDAYKFISELIKSAKKSIILIDNYIDESVLKMFSKREKM